MSYLDNYRLDAYRLGNPFEQASLRPRRPQATPQVPAPAQERGEGSRQETSFARVPAEDGAALPGLIDTIGKIYNQPDESIVNVLDRADRAMKALPPIGTPPYVADGSRLPQQAAMTPLEGPDTGEANPNRGYFARLQGPESGGNPSIRNATTGAGGFYQFLPSTWQSIMKEAPQLGLTPTGFYDPSPEGRAQQDRAARYYTDESMRRLVPALGRKPTAGELYALHFLGHSGGMKLLSGLDSPAGETVSPAAVEANPWLKKYVNKPGRALLARLEEMMG